MARPPPTNLIVPASLAGERLDRAIAALGSNVSRGEARRLIAAGVVFVAGRRTGISSRQVREGERISWEVPARRRETGLHGEPRIVIERDDLWIIDKPAGMPTELVVRDPRHRKAVHRDCVAATALGQRHAGRSD